MVGRCPATGRPCTAGRGLSGVFLNIISEMTVSRLSTALTGYYPTPFEYLGGLTRKLGGAKIWVKRDDMTGLALGGSKTRALSTLLGAAIAEGADTVVTCGPITSNHVRLTAAAANRLGLKVILVLRSKGAPIRQGNMLINHVLKAKLVHADVENLADLDPVMEKVASNIAAKGGKPFIIPGGGYSPVGAAGYLGLINELKVQSIEQGIPIDGVVFASGSGCIQSGLHLGNAFHSTRFPIYGVTINRSVQELKSRIKHDVSEAGKLLGMEVELQDSDVTVLDDYLGPGYAKPSAAGMDAIDLLAKTEGLLLDPCYTGKAMSAVIDLSIREFSPDHNLVFIHTGGTPGIFSYADELSEIVDADLNVTA